MALTDMDAGMYHCLALTGAPTVPILPPDFGERCFGSSALWALLDGEVSNDTSIKVQGGDRIGAHRCVLEARCPALASIIKEVDTRGHSESGCAYEVDLSEHRLLAVQALLEYLYCDYCRAAPDIAASLKPLADSFSLMHLAAGVSAATQTESFGSGVCWVRTVSGKWTQVATETGPRPVVASTYAKDMLKLLVVDDEDNVSSDFVKLCVKEFGSTSSRIIRVARPLLLTSAFFRALLEGGFAESQDFRSGSGILEGSADDADALILCLQISATGDAGSLMPRSSDELLAVLAEAHRLGFPDVLSAAELALGKQLAEGDLDANACGAVAHAAKIYDLERLCHEAATAVCCEA
jgi:hypothetical protein